MAYTAYLVATISTLLLALLAASTLHELGHYAAARAAGVQVLAVQIGVGRPFVSWESTRQRVRWSISLLPFGGKTILLDSQRHQVDSRLLPRCFDRVALAKRAVIVLGGSAANLVIPILILAWLLTEGIVDGTPTIRQPRPGTAAANAGFNAGDRILFVGRHAVPSIWSVDEEVRAQLALGLPFDITAISSQDAVKRLGVDGSLAARLQEHGWITVNLGLERIRGDAPAVLGRVVGASPAATAGLETGDRIVGIDGAPVHSWAQLATAVERAPGKVIHLQIRRGTATLELQVKTGERDFGIVKTGLLGVYPMEGLSAPTSARALRTMPSTEAFRGSALYAVGIASTAVRNLTAPIAGPLSSERQSRPTVVATAVLDSMHGGPLRVLAILLGVSLGIGWFNLLPIPPMDGWRLVACFFVRAPVKNLCRSATAPRPLPSTATQNGRQEF